MLSSENGAMGGSVTAVTVTSGTPFAAGKIVAAEEKRVL
jgi:hypothetical protein